ncbi:MULTISPECIES: outer membrane beta-barrel protein [Rhodopseudomonas]|uniref:Membrane protein n=1 Tax=Rhodopseudomonas palustris TaxID=1076 RepID=A0A0D7E4N1_RHOPL|nr:MULTISPECIES: outer membrane beta-barrel protein [Rhodopseudomonas]KIZ35813.1 membrane protein [Rhodopseudomonas palustris]MDF3812637.1 outer membrane beta-barrel protein [Rhodopseudomonas sp. BAL398]WOK17117.1 outer membrane beta-barrel protein [Rhodopseudomonas sp. BAL398]
MTSGPATGRHRRAACLRVALACLGLVAIDHVPASAQRLTADLLRPVRGGFVAPQDLPLRKTDDPAIDDPLDNTVRIPETAAPSRIGNIPTYGTAAAAGSGTAEIGYDSLNRKRRKPKYYPGAPKPKPAPGPGTAVVDPAPRLLTGPPSARANKAPVSAALAGTAVGQPTRRRLKADTDPFGAVGDYAGSFLVKSAIELRGGYDSNPGRVSSNPKGAGFYVVAPELMVTSDWDRHALVADLRGSYTGYAGALPSTNPGVQSAPINLDRPDFTGHIDGRIDVSRDTRLLGEARLRLSTDNPGSPNIEAGLAKYPIFTTTGGSFGIDQNFNRLQVTVVGNVDRTVYQNSRLTDGTTDSNADRNFNQYGGAGRVSYEVLPWLKPFVEVEGDTRVHDTAVDRGGYQRDSSGGYAMAGTSFELTRLLTGEASIGYATRTYSDPRLQKLTGLLTSGSLIWTVTPLTTAKFIATSSVDESTLAGVSGVLSRSYTAEVDHDFRRWLTAIGRFTWGSLDYQGSSRYETFHSISGDLVYKLNRTVQVNAQVRHEWLDSNVAGSSNKATIVMLGVRLQN